VLSAFTAVIVELRGGILPLRTGEFIVEAEVERELPRYPYYLRSILCPIALIPTSSGFPFFVGRE
jgi:hypothetical protein